MPTKKKKMYDESLHLSVDLDRGFVEREIQLCLPPYLAQHLMTARVER